MKSDKVVDILDSWLREHIGEEIGDYDIMALKFLNPNILDKTTLKVVHAYMRKLIYQEEK